MLLHYIRVLQIRTDSTALFETKYRLDFGGSHSPKCKGDMHIRFAVNDIRFAELLPWAYWLQHRSVESTVRPSC
jgi:hypothetical protein